MGIDVGYFDRSKLQAAELAMEVADMLEHVVTLDELERVEQRVLDLSIQVQGLRDLLQRSVEAQA